MPDRQDWEQLVQMLPMLLSQIKGGPGAGAFMEGFQRGQMVRQQEEMRKQQMGLQERQEGRAEQEFKAQVADRERARQIQEAQERRQAATAARTSMKDVVEQATANVGDVTSAENQVLGGANAIEALYGIAPGLLNPYVSQVAPTISARLRKVYQDALKEIDEKYEGGLQTAYDSNMKKDFGPDSGLGRVSVREMFEKVGGVFDEQGKLVFPKGARPKLTRVETGGGTTFVDESAIQPGQTFPKNPPAGDDVARELRKVQLQAAQDKLEAGREKEAGERTTRERQRTELETRTDQTLNEIDRLLTPDKQRLTPAAEHITGLGRLLQRQSIPGSPEANAQASLSRVASRLIIDLMAEMKSQSRTGATGFGQLSERELDVLQQAAARLSTRQSADALLESLLEIRRLAEKSNREAKAARQPAAPATPRGEAPPEAPVRRFNPATGKVE